METNDTNSVESSTELDISEAGYDPFAHEKPAEVGKHLEFLTLNENGHLLLGSSHLTGRYWYGSVWYYSEPSLAPDIEASQAGLEFNGGVTDAAFIEESKAIVGEDGGILNFLTITNYCETPRLTLTHQIDDFGHSISSIKVTCDRKTAITASLDMSVRIWDCQTAVSIHNFNPAHTQEIMCVSTHPTHPDLFLTSALDGNVLLWDLRCSRPAQCVYRDLDDFPSAVSWVSSQGDENAKFAVGTVSGNVHLRAKANLSESLTSVQLLKRPVFRMEPNGYRAGQLAVCANETLLIVCSFEEDQITTSYKDDRHTDFVRGLAWLNKNTLLSCGWDKQVLEHKI